MKVLSERIRNYFLSADGRDEIYVRVLLLVTAFSCIVIHGGLLIGSLIMGVPVVAYINMVSVTIYFIMLYLTHKRIYNKAAVIASIEITLYCVIIQCIMGGCCQSFVFLFILSAILMHLSVDYTSFYLRLTITFFSAILMGVVALYGQFDDAAPIIKLTEYQSFTYSFAYLFIGIFSIVFGLLLQLLTRDYVNRLDDESVKNLSIIAYTDNLTGLYNRQYAKILFEDLIIRDHIPDIVVAMVDVDNFKRVNDTFGHDAGDFILKTIAKIAKKHFRVTDYIFRWGGEEILIFLIGSNMDNGTAILNIFREKVNNNKVIKNKLGYYLSITIGVSKFDVDNTQESIKLADARLYYGKTHGKNRVVSQDMQL